MCYLKIFENISLFLRLQYFILPSVDINMTTYDNEEVEFLVQRIVELENELENEKIKTMFNSSLFLFLSFSN